MPPDWATAGSLLRAEGLDLLTALASWLAEAEVWPVAALAGDELAGPAPIRAGPELVDEVVTG